MILGIFAGISVFSTLGFIVFFRASLTFQKRVVQMESQLRAVQDKRNEFYTKMLEARAERNKLEREFNKQEKQFKLIKQDLKLTSKQLEKKEESLGELLQEMREAKDRFTWKANFPIGSHWLNANGEQVEVITHAHNFFTCRKDDGSVCSYLPDGSVTGKPHLDIVCKVEDARRTSSTEFHEVMDAQKEETPH